ncbi:MAG: DUF1669 domain-containing protein [Chloroflexi bacterium]|nr:DUF1669 domain-containing protein [Chloroflexota bacterium]
MKQILSLFWSMMVLAACLPKPATPSGVASSEPAGSAAPSLDWIEVHFTDPAAPHADDYRGGPDEELAAAIDAARLSVDVAVYNLNLWSIRNALLDAHRRGVSVRLVVESDNLDGDEIQDLAAAGIPVLGDRREGLMHHKFVVIDRAEVWLGSMNFTVSGGYQDNNHLLRIRSVQVAENYTHEFDEMFMDDLFGPDSVADTPNPELAVNGVSLEVYFSPDDGIAARLLELLEGAQDSIHFLAFSFTADDLGEAIRLAAANGLTVAGVMETEQVNSNQGTEFDPFAQAGLDVRLDGNKGQMHHKALIIDASIVVTGSYNFSASAETRNDENLLVIYSPVIAAAFMEEFWRVYAQAAP